MSINNTEPIKDEGKGQNSLRSFVRGGQTTIHSLRMFGQVIQVVAGVYFFTVAVVVGVWLWGWTEAYERYLTYKFYEAEFYALAGAAETKELWIEFPEGEPVKAMLVQILTHPTIQAAKDGLIETVYESYAWGSALGGLLIMIVLWFFVGHGFGVVRERQTRGAELVSHGILNRMIRAHNRSFLLARKWRAIWRRSPVSTYQPFHIADTPYPWRAETLHTMIAGTTGTGKTTIIRKLVADLRERGEKAVIFDKMGNYVEEFYDSERDIILNPLDQRCPRWSLFMDARGPNDYDTIAEAMIPQPKKSEPVWTDSARAIFSIGAQLLKREGRGHTATLIELLLKTNLEELEEFFEGTIGAPIINKDSARMSNSVRMMLNTYLRPLALLPNDGPPFSIGDWMRDDNQNGFLFLTSRADMHATLRPLISAWMDIAIKTLLSRPRSMDRITWFIIDEVAALHRLPSLEEGLKEGRQFGACYALGVQVQSQLREIYGPDGAQTISGLCRNRVVLAASDRETAEWYSGALGKREIQRLEEGFSYGASVIRDGVSFNAREKSELIVLPEEILNLRNLTGYIKMAEGFPAARFHLPYHHYDKMAAPYIERPGAQELAERIVREEARDKNSTKSKRSKASAQRVPTRKKTSAKIPRAKQPPQQSEFNLHMLDKE